MTGGHAELSLLGASQSAARAWANPWARKRPPLARGPSSACSANVAARLEGLAEPGGICVSGRVREEIARKLTVGFAPMGAQWVKNIAEPVEAWRVVPEPSHAPRGTWSETPGGGRPSPRSRDYVG